MPKILAALVLVLAGNFALDAQTLVKVSGVVTSSDDGLPMMGVAVMQWPGSRGRNCSLEKAVSSSSVVSVLRKDTLFAVPAFLNSLYNII